MNSMRRFLTVGGVSCLLFLSTNCGKLSSTGVCTGYSSEYNSTYCKDDWTKDECEEWNDLHVNGVTWHFHPGQTCEERGTPATL
jgi:hypothetical protein